MKLQHAAIWTRDLEALKTFYTTLLGGEANDKYTNPTTGFESYFLSFGHGAQLEIMTRGDVAGAARHPEILTLPGEDAPEGPRAGFAHIAFDTGSPDGVDRMVARFRAAGIPILRGPRVTGDGYYEFETEDPDGNRLEITASAR